ncbi:hypothetical protein M405DRAFT_132977 [Rhizopogon salebrosus TDB-379]|nr:hypothetical protein M405DRAFT_132977 [Rhizopogon salebrosus TDB-379]
MTPPLDSPKVFLGPTTRMVSEGRIDIDTVLASCSLCSPTSITCSTSAGWSMSCSRSTSAIFCTVIRLTLLDRQEVHVTRQTLAELAIYTLFDPSTRPHDDYSLPL